MGCSSSTLVGDDTPAPRPAKNKSQQKPDPASLTLPEVTWETDKTWAEWLCVKEQELITARRHNELPSSYQELVFKSAREYLAKMYPECEANGTIEDIGECHICMGAGHCSGDDKCKSPTSSFLVLDASFTGIVHSLAVIIAKSPAKLEPHTTESQQGEDSTQTGSNEHQTWLIPGRELDSPEMRAAKYAMLQKVAYIKADGVNVNHALINIFIGADLVTCRFDASPKPPTINCCTPELPKGMVNAMNGIAKDTKKAPHAFRGIFAPNWFRRTVQNCSRGYEGSTVWDEGPLPFKLPNRRIYHEPTRLLVTRMYDKMTEKIDEISFTATPPPFPGTENETSDTVTLVRKADPTKEPGGIVRITLVIGISKAVIWPNIGDYAKTSTMQAGEKAVMEYAKSLHANGVLDRCVIRVYMGTDESVFKFVGDPKSLVAETRPLPHPTELGTASGLAGASTAQDPMTDKSLEIDFGLKIALQPKHELMGSESQFQAIKQYMTDKAKDKTQDQLKEQAMMIAPMTARMFLSVNFPGCEVSDEGPFPIIHPDGTETLDHDTRLLVARDPKQEPGSVVAAINVVPYPAVRASIFSDKNWLETPEMKEADDRLLQLLKKWYVQGKTSKVDCMAQTMMVKDATIYKFVDGERFEDYSEERMSQFKWG
ncbi:alpha beta-hydrolase [Fusarium beomiforme]|uniref:Alpha beta-hydrolase n=1 Tax=Fusarium beomiforme TaxID=44412 RepID=A0A9P5A4C9_9HYPO|nr:alpha beta-hydrolase [Fusarium beomiforme]